VVTAAGSNWRYGATREKQEKLQPLLEALQELRDGGLTATGVVAAIHRRRVLPLAERRLLLSEMMPGVDLEGSQMSSVSLSADDLRRQVAGTVGRLDVGALTQPLMRPEHGCVSLVSARSFKRQILLLSCVKLPLILTVGISVRLQELWCYKPSLPPVPEDAVDRAARRVTAEKKKEKKDAEKARACERMRARDALERRRQRQERNGLPREPSPETPDDDDDDDDDEDDDMAARLGFSPDLRLGQGSSSQPPSGLASSVSGAGTSGSRSEGQGQVEGELDPLAEVVEVTPGSRADLPVSQERLLVLAVQEVGPRAVVMAHGQAVPSAPRAPEVGTTPKPAAGRTSAAPAGTEARPRGLPAGTIGLGPEWVSI
jgi:hypothetical protein